MPAFSRALTVVENVVAAAALAAAAAIAVIAVVLRYLFNILVFWSEEAVIYLVILSVFVGAVITLRHDEHVRVDFLAQALKGRAQQAVRVLASVLTLVYLGCLGTYAWLLLLEPASRLTVTPALKLPLWVVYFALPLGLTLMFLRMLEVLLRQLRGQDGFPESAKSVLQAEAAVVGMDLGDARQGAGSSLQASIVEAVRLEDAGRDPAAALRDVDLRSSDGSTGGPVSDPPGGAGRPADGPTDGPTDGPVDRGGRP